MNMENDAYYYDLAQRIEDAFIEIDNDICTALRNANDEYAKMWREFIGLQSNFPVILQVTEGSGAVSLLAEEHDALLQYLSLKNDMENLERKEIYFRGHTDNYAYLKKIGAV